MKRKDKNSGQENQVKVDSALYDAWIKYLFDRPTTWPLWCDDIDLIDFTATPEEFVALIGETMRRSGTDLRAYSDAQVANGLKYIFYNSVSNTVFTLVQDVVDESARAHAVRQIKHLYRDCFAKRCANVLSHRDEPGSGELNIFCYMLWDESPLSSWQEVVLEVMEDALTIPNYACIESALHGLGHRTGDRSDVAAIIDNFLERTPQLRPELVNYAKAARAGCVQ